MVKNQILGKFGENLAKNYLIKKGFDIICCNWRYSYYEIDIIAKIKEKIIFVEVKTRLNTNFGTAQDNLSARKIKKIKKAIQYFLLINNNYTQEPRVDAITIDIDKYKRIAKIKHFKNII
jgi:putative endonuclease